MYKRQPFVIRQNIPNEGTTTFHDELYGDITVDNAELDDMILIKSDGYPTYNFANVVDDHTMNITHCLLYTSSRKMLPGDVCHGEYIIRNGSYIF